MNGAANCMPMTKINNYFTSDCFNWHFLVSTLLGFLVWITVISASCRHNVYNASLYTFIVIASLNFFATEACAVST